MGIIMKKSLNIMIYGVLILVVLLGNISIVNFIIKDKEIKSIAEATSEPAIKPEETPENAYYVLVEELPLFKYNTITENKSKDARMGTLKFGAKVAVPVETAVPAETNIPGKTSVVKKEQVYTKLDDGGYVWSDCIGRLSENAGLSSPRPKVVVIDAGKQKYPNKETEKIGPGAVEEKEKVSSGATGAFSNVKESILNLAIAKKVEKKLEKNGYVAVMVRKTDDIDISGADRARLANQIKADAMISIHCSSDARKGKRGVTVYCNTKDSPYINKKKYPKNKLLAESILDAYTQKTNFKNRGVKESNNYLNINWCKVPMAMIEMGYLTNEKEDKIMSSMKFQNKMADGIVNGIEEYFDKVTEDKNNTTSTNTNIGADLQPGH